MSTVLIASVKAFTTQIVVAVFVVAVVVVVVVVINNVSIKYQLQVIQGIQGALIVNLLKILKAN